jgi:methionine synthase II (cobalamin-independent)
MEINLSQNFAVIVNTLQQRHNMKFTHIAKAIGFTTTTQLHNSMGATSSISTKAIIGIILNLNVNPTFLFLGKGEMFITDESEVERLKKENLELEKRVNESGQMVSGLREVIKQLEKRNADLIDLSSAAIKYHKEHKEEETKTEENK